MPNHNHVIIGLGGTGGKIIRALRKTIFQEFRSVEPDGVNLAYLYVDSSEEMMGLDDPSWKIFGQSVQLGASEQLRIQGANLSATLENIGNFPGMRDWIGDKSIWRDILNAIVGPALGGQKRRLGRFLFACQAVTFRDRLRDMVNALRIKGSADVTFHVCCGLAGGTGGGSIIDVITQIRDAHEDPKRFRILVYAMMPDKLPKAGWDTGNYHANGYAALMELNALSVGTYQPFDVTGEKKRIKAVEPFNGCYLFTDENENNVAVDVDAVLPGIVGDFLYQKIVAVKNLGEWRILERMENAENGDNTPETAPGSKKPERSKRFMTFGIKRLAIPEEEIREYLTFHYARQGALQLRYAHWEDGFGFTDVPIASDYAAAVRQQDTLQRWELTDDHLCQSLPILPEDQANKRWKKISNEWADVMPHFVSLVREGRVKRAWLGELAKLCEKRFNQDFRGLGVMTFFEARLRAKKGMAHEIRQRIELELFDSWTNGAMSMHDISLVLAALRGYTEERLRDCDGKVTGFRDDELRAAEAVESNNRGAANVGFFRISFGSLDRSLEIQSGCLRKLYTVRTWLQAWQFAKALLQELLNEFDDLKAEVDRATSTISQATERFEASINHRCNDQQGESDLRQQLVRFYDPLLVRRITNSFIRNEDEQRTQTSRIRTALVSRLGAGQQPTFHLFNQRLPLSAFMDTLEAECEQSAEIAHSTLISDPRERLLGVSIIEKLRDRYGADSSGFLGYLTDVIRYAGDYVKFDQAEFNKRGAGIPTAPNRVKNLTVILPRANDHTEFFTAIKDTLRRAATTSFDTIQSDIKRNEITFVSLANLFPLRFLEQVSFLRSKYERRVCGVDDARARLELHTEGDGTQHPPLFIPSTAEVQADARPYLLLGKVLGLIQSVKSSDNTRSQLCLITKDADGFEILPIELGQNLFQAVEKLDSQKGSFLKDSVETALASSTWRAAEKRNQVKEALLAELNAMLEEHGRNEEYQKFSDAGRTAAALLKKE